MNASNNAAEAPEKSATRRCRASETALVNNCGLFLVVVDAWVLVALLIYHHPQATRPGDKVIAGKTCSLCTPETGGLGAAAVEFLEIIDVHQSRGTPGNSCEVLRCVVVRNGSVSVVPRHYTDEGV